MSDERFILCYDDLGNCEIRYDDKVFRFLWEVAEILNAQQATIIKQDEEIKKLKRTERSWRRIHCCNKESDNCGIVIGQEATIKQLQGKVKRYGQLNSDYKYLREVNKETVKQCERWKNLYDIKDAEVTARVDALNEVCEYYLTEAQFKADTDPNEAVHEVINRILNTEVKW